MYNDILGEPEEKGIKIFCPYIPLQITTRKLKVRWKLEMEKEMENLKEENLKKKAFVLFSEAKI